MPYYNINSDIYYRDESWVSVIANNISNMFVCEFEILTVEEMGQDPNYDPYDEIMRRMNQYPRAVLVADQGGDLIGIRKLQAKYPGRVYLCWFTKENKNKELTRWGEGDEDGKVLVDRNRMIQLVVDQIREQRLTFNGTQEDWQPFFTHSMNIYRVKEIQGQDENDPQYGWRWVWKRKGPDHWFMSMIYALVGLDKFGEDAAIIINNKGFMSGIPTGRIFNTNQDWEVDGGITGIIRGEKI